MARESLSSGELATLEYALTTISLNVYGSLATIPLYCLGEIDIGVADTRCLIEERYDLWRSFLVVLRAIMRWGPSSLGNAVPAVESLSEAIGEIRDSYIEIADYKTQPVEKTMTAHRRLVGAFDRITRSGNAISQILKVHADHLALTGNLNLRRKFYENTFDWLGEELLTKSTMNHNAVTADAH